MALFIFLGASGHLLAQAGQQTTPFQPQVGQPGKDVIWVPTPQVLVNKMLDMAKVTSQDFVMDLGSGDGRIVITAAKRGARAMGIEYNPDMVELSKANAAKEGVSDKTTFMKADLFETDLSKATVITMYLLPSINLTLRPKLLELKPGTRLVSQSFDMGDWHADQTVTLPEGCPGGGCVAYSWIVPAKAEGKWQLSGGELALTQEFQTLSGTLTLNSKSTPISSAKMAGDQITFKAGSTVYTGRVTGNAIEGTAKGTGNSTPWKATRAGK
jgi:phospholipid N-methyltransferase